MKVSKFLFLLIVAALFFISCSSEPFIVKGMGPESITGKPQADVKITSYNSSGTEDRGYYQYTLTNSGKKDVSIVTFNITYKVDLTPTKYDDNLFKEYTKTIIYTQKIVPGQTHYDEGEISLKPVDSKMLTTETPKVTKTVVKKTYNSKQYEAYTTNLEINVTNSSNIKIDEMFLEVEVKAKAIVYSEVNGELQGEYKGDVSKKIIFTVKELEKMKSKKVTAANVQFDLTTLTADQKKRVAYEPITEYAIITDKKIIKPTALHETLKSVTITGAVSAE